MDQIVSFYEKWIQLPRWQKWLLILLLGMVLMLLIYYFKILPMKETLEKKRREARSLALTVNRLKLVEKRKSLLMKELEELRKRIKEIEEKLPSGKEEVSQIIRTITTSDSGMVIKSIQRERTKSHRYYVEYPYRVELLGTYPSYIHWCEKLSRANRIINFGPMRIEAVQTSEKQASKKKAFPSRATIKITLEVKAFTLLE